MVNGTDKARRVPLHSPGGYVGAIINGQWLESPPCHEKRCKAIGGHRHVFDITTGLSVIAPHGVVTEDMPEIVPANGAHERTE